MKAIFNGKVIAESDKCEVVEGNQYFPADSIKKEYFKPSAKNTTYQCTWKGEANYYDVEVDGKVEEDVAWYYPDPTEKAKNIKGYIAFYKDRVEITE